MSFANRLKILKAPAPNPRDCWPRWTDQPVQLGPVVPDYQDLTPRWRSVVLTTRDLDLDRLDGFGVRLVEDLVRLAHDAHQVDLRDAILDGEDRADFAAACGDQVVWDGNRVVAILRPLPDGSLEDTRFPASGFLTGSSDDCERGAL